MAWNKLFSRLSDHDRQDALLTARNMAEAHQAPVGIFVRVAAATVIWADSFVLWKAEVLPAYPQPSKKWTLTKTIHPW